MIDRCERDTSCLLGKSNTVAERGEETKSTEGESIQMQPSGFSSLLMKHRRSADVTWTTSSAIQENKKQETIVTFWPQWCIYVYIIPNGHFFPPPHIIMCDSQTVVHHRGLIKDPLKLRIFFSDPSNRLDNPPVQILDLSKKQSSVFEKLEEWIRMKEECWCVFPLRFYGHSLTATVGAGEASRCSKYTPTNTHSQIHTHEKKTAGRKTVVKVEKTNCRLISFIRSYRFSHAWVLKTFD